MKRFAWMPLLALAACLPQPVEWGEPTYLSQPIEAATQLTFDANGVPHFATARTPPTWPTEPGLCTATLRATQIPGDTAYASFLTVKADSSVLLRVARSNDGGRTWGPPMTADTTDRGRAGCARPVPDIFADSSNGYVYVVSFLDAIEGAGLFFTHTMDGGGLWHQPVPIVYGDRPSNATVVSRGDTVIVAYEDPNSRKPRLSLALSRTQGHNFQHRISASDENGEATMPRVAVRGLRLALAWTETPHGGASARTALRTGTLQW